MEPLLTCPGRAQLDQFVAGKLSAEELNQFAEHLEQCCHCAEALENLPAYQQLFAEVSVGLRSAPPSWTENLGKPQLPLQEASLATIGETVNSTLSSAELLAPAQLPDEMGRFGAFRILAILGQGGMGLVYQAEDTQLKRRVALKVMHADLAAQPTARERFLREAQAAASLEHDHIVPIYQVGEERAMPFFAMQWLKGMSLADWLKQQPQVPLSDILRLGGQIALGLAAAHKIGLIHRDIKPSNLWLEDTGEQPQTSNHWRVKILDFGLARPMADTTHLTQQGTIVGTPAYMAPEQAAGHAPDQRCDLFSFGVVLYQMCTGQQPFRGENVLAVLTALALQTPSRPRTLNPQVPEELDALVMQLLAKNPEERPASAREIAERLQTLERRLTSAAPNDRDAAMLPPDQTPTAPTPKRPRRRLLAVCGVALLALLPLGYFYGGTVINIATNKGVLVIDSKDPNLVVTVKGKTAAIYDKVKDRRFVLTAGDYEVEVREEGDGGVRLATKRFSITRGGEETFIAELKLVKAPDKKESPSPVQKEAPEAPSEVGKAVQAILMAGGKVTVREGGQEREVKTVKELPPEPFKVVAVNFDDHPAQTDNALKLLRPLKDLRNLSLARSKVSEDGLAHLKTLTGLKTLNLQGTRIKEGLEHLQTLVNLKELNLQETRLTEDDLAPLQTLVKLHTLVLKGLPLTDHGLVHLKPLPWLRVLDLDDTNITDAGLQPVREMTKLQQLRLCRTKVTDAGLQALQPLTSLEALSLDGTRVTAEGLAHLETLKDSLRELSLERTAVTDAALDTLKQFTMLQRLSLAGAKVTTSLVPKLLQALPPSCKLVMDQRQIAEWVLGNGGGVRIAFKGTEQDIGKVTDLPAKAFDVVSVEGKFFTDKDLSPLHTLGNLRSLNLNYTRISDDGLVHLQPLANLQELDLAVTKINGMGLSRLKPLTKLKRLDLRHATVTDVGLAGLQALTNLEVLCLSYCSQLGPASLVHLRPLTKLKDLAITYANVNGDSLAHLEPLTQLIALNLCNTNVTDAGMKHLERLTNLVALKLSVTKVTDAGLQHLKPLSKLTHLACGNPKIGNTGLVHLKEHIHLKSLDLGGTKVSDTGMVHLQGLTNLQDLRLDHTQITSAGLVSLKRLTNLRVLILDYTKVADAGLKELAALHGLYQLNLAGTEITNAGLVYLKPLTKLNLLYLGDTRIDDDGLKLLTELGAGYFELPGTKITDAGLKHLKKYTWVYANLERTQVTAAGLDALRKTHPKFVLVGPTNK